MNDFSVKLFARFPMYFRPSNLYSLMRFGVESNAGWNDLVWKLCESIEALNPPSNFEVVQVKSKFAQLSFYVKHSTPAIDALIHDAQVQSKVLCEECGQPGKNRIRRGWFIVACEQHALDIDGNYLEPIQ